MHIESSKFAGYICGAVFITAIASAVLTYMITRLLVTRRFSSGTELQLPHEHELQEPNTVADFWSPQMDDFRADEYDWLNDDYYTYIVHRIRVLASKINQMVEDAFWKQNPSLDIKKFLHDNDYPVVEHAVIVSATDQLCDPELRGSILAGFLARILITNIMLHGSPQWTILSPEAVSLLEVAE